MCPFAGVFFLRLGVDDLRTWLFNGEQNQVRAAAGICLEVWKWK